MHPELQKTIWPMTYQLQVGMNAYTVAGCCLPSSQAIERELKTSTSRNGISRLVDRAVVDACYAAWLEERHAAAERHLYPEARDALVEIRRLFPEVCIGAITNGAGDPYAMPTLKPFFQFRVSGEDPNIFPFRKPSPRIYQVALERYNGVIDETRIWCHVGDCLAHDVKASVVCGAKAIWLAQDHSDDVKKQPLPSWSTTTRLELERRIKLAEEGRMLVAAQIPSLAELSNAIGRIIL